MHLSTDIVKGKCDVCGGLIVVRTLFLTPQACDRRAICTGCYRMYPEHDEPQPNNDSEDDCA